MDECNPLNDGVTPLMACMETEDIKMVRALLAFKADSNIQVRRCRLTLSNPR